MWDPLYLATPDPSGREALATGEAVEGTECGRRSEASMHGAARRGENERRAADTTGEPPRTIHEAVERLIIATELDDAVAEWSRGRA